jgi:protoporphyrin/coproporphyrin ferrochelatase
MSETKSAVLLMAYGTPETLDDVGPYFTHIRGGRKPSDEAIAHLRERYERVGGGTPLRAITEAVRDRLEQALAAEGLPRRVYFGMKHWHPYIADVVRQIVADGVTNVTAIVLAPHYSRMSIGSYRKTVEETNNELGTPLTVTFVESWHRRPEFIEMMSQLVVEGLAKFGSKSFRVLPVFTAHSLPARIREWKDPYEIELMTSAASVADRLEMEDWRFAWQSAGGTSEPWLGPDILDYLETLKKEGVTRVLQIPIGFVSDHLEVLYDIDLEAKQKAAELGMILERTPLPNATPALIRTLVAIVRDPAVASRTEQVAVAH